VFENLRARFGRKNAAAPRAGTRLSLTVLEDRTVPSGNPPPALGVSPLFGAPPGGGVHAAAGSGRQAGVQQSDLNFLTKSVQGHEQEMILGSLAMVLGQDQGVRSFGATLWRDHARLFAAALPLLRQNGLSLPALDATMLQHIQQIAALRGSDFDTAFVNYMVQDHTTDVQDFTTEIQSGADQRTKDYAQDWLIPIQEHLHIAQGFQQNRGGNGNSGGGGLGGNG
jgi:putative membrane protein